MKTKKIFPIILVFTLCCNLNAQTINLAREYLSENNKEKFMFADDILPSFQLKNPFENPFEDPDAAIYIELSAYQLRMDPPTPDPGETDPIGGGLGFLAFSSLLFGVRCFYKDRKIAAKVKVLYH